MDRVCTCVSLELERVCSSVFVDYVHRHFLRKCESSIHSHTSKKVMAVTCTWENVLIRIRSGDKAKIDVVTSTCVFSFFHPMNEQTTAY